MSKQAYEYTTDEIVEETGDYICESGVTRTLEEGSKFPSCPDTEVVTYWKRANSHSHASGQEVLESGRYVDEDGDEALLEAGAIFPNCPKSGVPTTWSHAG
ncbi:hypothetical protein H9650_08205 [Psychrobacillus sp. Sa2BUA9]|uniref:Uncharacterized protein n=1 Tax=Psychrobacillus faecigallinarum TaxID=2762235 RepID=A0ABR8R8R0_9BACI|nr:hypothetical protein [Psychrobacillus faecigallinarum]MBD7944099.1 hypothetical protein [Psychrobacillus faecigallinarum]